MQPVLVSQSNREDEKPRFILLAFDLETDARWIELDSRHLRADYRPLISRLQVEQNVDPNRGLMNLESSRRATSNIHAAAPREWAW